MCDEEVRNLDSSPGWIECISLCSELPTVCIVWPANCSQNAGAILANLWWKQSPWQLHIAEQIPKMTVFASHPKPPPPTPNKLRLHHHSSLTQCMHITIQCHLLFFSFILPLISLHQEHIVTSLLLPPHKPSKWTVLHHLSWSLRILFCSSNTPSLHF